jgi:hypothetical protein
MPVPPDTVNEYCNPPTRKRNVWASWEVGVDAVASDAEIIQRSPQLDFWTSVFAANGRHHPVSDNRV